MVDIKCAICGEKEDLQDLYKANFDPKKINSKVFSARRTPDKVHYRLVRCRRCGLIFSNPILPVGKINKLYFQSDFNYTLEVSYLKRTYGYYLEQILPKNREKIRLLEVGCGNGFFLEEALKMGVGEVWGVEPGKPSVAKASKAVKDHIKVDILKKDQFKSSFFDIICCFQTLDHLIDPNRSLDLIYKYLKKGGKVLFINHDTNGLSVKLFGESSAIFDIEHIYLFNKESMKKIFLNHKFRSIKTFDVKNSYPFIYWSRMIPIPKSWKAKLLNILRVTHLGDIQIAIKAGNLGLIATK